MARKGDRGVRNIRVHGRRVWQARVAWQGQRRSRLCESYEAARQAKVDMLADLQREAAKTEAEGQQPATLRQLFAFYVADLEARGKGPETVARAVQTETAIARLLPVLLDTPVSRIRDRDLYDFRLARAREGKLPSTINRDLRTLRAMLKAARPDFRFPGGAFFPEDETRVRWLRPEEELLVLEPMPEPFRTLAKLAALTLMRQGELRLLRREHVHLEQGVVLLPRAKAGARPVILAQEARKLLQAALESHPDSQWAFPGPGGHPYSRVHVSRVFRKASRGAGLRDFHFHDLRHHGATMALNKGFTAPIVQALGGWKTERMMRRYAAVTDETLRAAAEAVAGNEQWQRLAKSAPAQAV